MHEIREIKGRQIMDSRGDPTIEVEVFTDKCMARASVPSGSSIGKYEAVELRDGGKEFNGKGVRKALRNISEEIYPLIRGMDIRSQREIDEAMIQLDGTENKSRLGANAILAVSMAVAKNASSCSDLPLYRYIRNLMGERKENENRYTLPIPFMNVINGGKHAGNELDIQEHLIAPIDVKNFEETMRMCSEIYHSLKGILKSRYGKMAINVGDEGGFAPPLSDSRDALNFIERAIEECGYNKKVRMALDAAASEFYEKGEYILQGKSHSSNELVDLYKELVDEYRIISIEDPFAQDDWDGFILLTKEIGDKIQLIGDDLFASNVERIKKGIEKKACNAVLLKLNQIGTVSEGIDAAELAFKNGYKVMVSHRSGETCDSFIADLVVGINAGQIKSGAPCRGERTSKYNQLLRIEEELGSMGNYGKLK